MENNKLIINNAYKSFNIYNEDTTEVIGHYRKDSKLKTPESYREIPLTFISQRLKENLLKHKEYQQNLFKTSRALKDKHKKWSEDEYIFLNREHKPFVSETLTSGMRKFRTKYKLSRVTPYGLRRSFATYWSYKNLKKIVLMKLMGHANYETTVKHYIKVDSKQIEEEMQKVIQTS